jgi:hypothetical protein
VKKLRVTFNIEFDPIDQPEPIEIEISGPSSAKISVAPEAAVSTQSAAALGEGVPPEVLAVIVATAAQVLEGPVRVHRIRYRTDTASAAWAQQGRMAIMTSRTVR